MAKKELSEVIQNANAVLGQMEEREQKLVAALRKMKAASWCENIDQQNEAYELADEALKAHKGED